MELIQPSFIRPPDRTLSLQVAMAPDPPAHPVAELARSFRRKARGWAAMSPAKRAQLVKNYGVAFAAACGLPQRAIAAAVDLVPSRINAILGQVHAEVDDPDQVEKLNAMAGGPPEEG